MRFLLFLAFLTAFVAAQEQVPLGDRVQGWFNKAKSYIPTATPVVPPQKAAAEKLPEKAVTPFTIDNYQSILEPSSEPQNWLVFVTGGNKTCFGRCDRAEKEFNESVNLFAADKTSPNLGYVNCEDNQVLCATWSAGAPTVWVFEVPRAQVGEERPATPLYIVNLNTTAVTSEGIFKIHSQKNYQARPAYEGIMHPTDGFLARTKLNIAMGYVIYGLGMIPNWLFMIGISFMSRTLMSRRTGNPGARRPAAQGAGSN